MQYVRMGDLNISKNPSLFDRVALTPLQTEVVKALQIIEPGIIDLNFLKDDRRRDRMTRDDERAPYIALELSLIHILTGTPKLLKTER